jgi:hypothetical protein
MITELEQYQTYLVFDGMAALRCVAIDKHHLRPCASWLAGYQQITAVMPLQTLLSEGIDVVKFEEIPDAK